MVEYSILDMSKLLNVPKSTVNKRIKELGLKPISVGKQGTQLFNDSAYKSLIESFNVNGQDNKSVDYESLYYALKAQLAEQSEQLKIKDKQIDQLQTIVSQSQSLQLMAEHKIKQLSEPVQDDQQPTNQNEADQQRPSNQPQPSTQQQSQKKTKSFLDRLLRK